MLSRILLFATIVFMISCAPAPDNGEIPEDLGSLRELQSQLKTEIRGLEDKLERVNNKIEELAPADEQKAALVTIETVSTRDFHHYVNMQAVVQSDDIVNLGSEAGGRIKHLAIEEGQNVNRGQLVARIDLESLRKQLAELETSYALAEDVYERQKRLWDQNIGTEMQYLQAKNNKERLEKSIEVLKHQMSKANVYAPISGVVENVIMKEGEFVSPGMPIVQIINTNDVKIVADLPESYLKAVALGDKVRIVFPALGDTTSGRISLVGRTIDPSNRTFKVEVELSNPDNRLKPNLLAEMIINDFTEEDVIVIPSNLMQQEVGGKKFVYVVDHKEPKSARKIYIETGKSGNSEIIVEKGLEAGDTLIVKGARGLAAGDPIQITEPRLTDNG
ncbi:MAG: efflux RND transporter periplasmic adaptor subunit [Saprospiraceae bacterium]|nr:efflux RND transporter periplasmic adaptor subunit [Saprospiraceae bacterium]